MLFRSVKIGTSDGNLGGEIVADATNVGLKNIIDFSMTIYDNQITLTSSLFAGTKSRSYGVIKTLNNAYGYTWDEFAEGAYLGGNLWGTGSFGFNVVASPIVATPVPAPGAILLAGLGTSVVGWLRRRRAL